MWQEIKRARSNAVSWRREALAQLEHIYIIQKSNQKTRRTKER